MPLFAFPIVLLQHALAHADRARRDFDEFVICDEFERLFEIKLDGRREQQVFIGARRTDIGELFGLQRIDHEIVIARMDADDHALVDFVRMTGEQAPAFLQTEQGIGECLAFAIRDQHPIHPCAEVAGFDWRVLFEGVIEQAFAGGYCHEFSAETDQAT